MSWWVIPVRLPPVELHLHADRRLAYEVLTAFGATDAADASSTVLKDEGRRKLVEFTSPVRAITGGVKRYKTVEWVTLRPPEEVLFEGVKGPLDLLRDRFTLDDVGGCTHFRYESTIGFRGSVVGWVFARLYIRKVLGDFMRSHSEELKATIEERARKSHVYPFRGCNIQGASSQ